MSNFLFTLHFEVGTDPRGGFYATTTIGGPRGVRFHTVAGTPAEALSKIALDMESSSMWGHVARNPSIATYPFNVSPPRTMVVDPKAPKKRPSDIQSVPHPDCTAICQAFDHFGKSRCKSICGHRSGL